MIRLVAPGLLVFVAIAANATAADEAPTELDPIAVTPQYLYDSDRQLSRIAQSLPDLGAPKGRLEQRSDPNTLGPLQQEMLLRTLGETDDRWR